MQKICYIGTQHYVDNYSSKNICFFNDVSFIDARYIEMNNIELIILEISKKDLDIILKWVFKVLCLKSIPILAILKDCDNKDKIILHNFGITEFIDVNNINLIYKKISQIEKWNILKEKL